MKPEVNYFIFAVLQNVFLIFIRVSKECLFYRSNDNSSTKLVCHDSNYVDMYLINFNCVSSPEWVDTPRGRHNWTEI